MILKEQKAAEASIEEEEEFRAELALVMQDAMQSRKNERVAALDVSLPLYRAQ